MSKIKTITTNMQLERYSITINYRNNVVNSSIRMFMVMIRKNKALKGMRQTTRKLSIILTPVRITILKKKAIDRSHLLEYTQIHILSIFVINYNSNSNKLLTLITPIPPQYSN